MFGNSTELIRHVKADEMARTFREALAVIHKARGEIEAATGALAATFGGHFSITVAACDHSRGEDLDAWFTQQAWRGLIDKIGIRKYMGVEDRDRLEKLLSAGRWQRYGEQVERLPPIHEDTIFDVLAGYVLSVDEFITSSIKEQFDHWCTRKWSSDYKTNREKHRISRKIVATWMVDRRYGTAGFRIRYGSEKWIDGLDNIFHILDRREFPGGYKGDLATSIETAEAGHGTSRYWKWRAFQNGNLHLTCLRPDILDFFNDIACDKAIPSQARIHQ